MQLGKTLLMATLFALPGLAAVASAAPGLVGPCVTDAPPYIYYVECYPASWGLGALDGRIWTGVCVANTLVPECVSVHLYEDCVEPRVYYHGEIIVPVCGLP